MDDCSNENSDRIQRRKWGLLAAGATGAVALGLCVVSAPFVTPALRKFCLPYVPATSRQVENVMNMCRSHPKLNGGMERLVDLGSGDGRIVLAAAKNGFMSTGVELNLWLVLYSRLSARFHGLNHKAKFHRKDLWKLDYSSYDKIVIFGVTEMMPTLKEKLANEIDNNCKVIACRFPIPTWTEIDSINEGIDSVWLYSADSFKEK
eukprot:Seg5556.1 transcript_id=Seg5556.1/GoldUCD/mRNA.D3Y31 product="Protein N-lysine methyltransferase FAM173B" protein_id=Seg5556.1/GoldUCD/D3Y31